MYLKKNLTSVEQESFSGEIGEFGGLVGSVSVETGVLISSDSALSTTDAKGTNSLELTNTSLSNDILLTDEGRESLEGKEFVGHAGLGRIRPWVSASGTLSVNSKICGLSSELQ